MEQSNEAEAYKEFDEDYDSNEVATKQAIFPTSKQIIIGFIFILITVIILEKSFISLFLYFIPSYFLLIIIWTLLHLIILRYLVYSCIFPGRNTLVSFYLRTVFGKIRAKSFSQSLDKFKSRIDKILQTGTNFDKCKSSSIMSQILSKSRVSSRYFDTYEKIKNKYGELSPYAQEFLDLLINFKNIIENSSLQEHLRKFYHKEEICLSEKDIKDYTNIISEIKNIQKFLSNYMGEFEFNLTGIQKYLKNLFYNDILKSKEFERVSAMIKKPNSKEILITTKNNIKLDTLLLFSDKKEDKICSNNLMIVCGPNLTPFENLINSWDIDSLYLSNDTDILFWNYRGYGFSEGSANFDNICDDILCIYDYITSNYQYKKIGVHGLSIGGVSACYLARYRNINLLIADRTFGSVKDILNNFPFGNIVYYFAKIIFITFVDNTKNFMQANCKKILMNDAEDRTIIDPISLKTSISKEIIYQFFNIKNKDFNIRNINSYNILDYALEPDQISEIFKAFKYTIDFIKDKNRAGSEMSLEKYLNDVNTDDKSLKLNEYEDNLETNNCNRHLVMKEISDVFYNKIKIAYSHFWGVGDSLERFCEYQNNNIHFNNFFNNLFVYGPEDTSLSDFSLCNIKNIDDALGIFIKECNEFLESDEIRQFNEYNIYKNFSFFVDCLKNLKIYLLGLHLEEKDREWMKENKGIIIPLYCGHILFYDDKELDTLKYLMKETFNKEDSIIIANNEEK